MSHILEAKGLNTFYGRSHILFDVSLEVSPGETVCLMGRNGAGKTTTFRSLLGLTPPKSGRVVFKGEDCTRFKPYRWPAGDWVSCPRTGAFWGLSPCAKTWSLGGCQGAPAVGTWIRCWSSLRC